MHHRRLLLSLLLSCVLISCAVPAPRASPEQDFARTIDLLRPLHRRMPREEPGDWLSSVEEPGQTFAEYLEIDPVRFDGPRRVLYVQPLGAFSADERRVVAAAADFLGRFFQTRVVVLSDKLLDDAPESARRVRYDGSVQYSTHHILMEVLQPALPDDAFALIALTSEDVWPGNDWNFVFGQASLRERVGVWSIARLGDPAPGPEAFELCLRRTLKISAHETVHMLTITHCTAYACVMNGSMHIDELDRHPVPLCAECVGKVCWATGAEIDIRYRMLIEFCRDHGLDDERWFYETSLAVLERNRVARR